MPARLFGTMENGASMEVLLVKRLDLFRWEVLMKPGKKAKVGMTFTFGNGELQCIVEEIGAEGIRIIRFLYQGVF